MGIVYLHTNRVNGKVRVGQTWDLEQRNAGYRCDVKNGKKDHFSNAIRKHGWGGFDHQIVGEADTQAELDNLEKVWIILLQARDRECGYNIREGGSRGRHAENTKKLMSLKMTGNKNFLGHKHSPEVCQGIKERMKGNKNGLGYGAPKGKPWSEARRSAQRNRTKCV